MKRLFFKKNLILKTFLLLFLFVILFFSANFFYNQNKDILAAEEEEIDYEKLKCGREIPVGEAMKKTGEFLEEIIRELERIEENSYLLIETHKKMEDLAKECSMENCIAKCEIFTIKNIVVGCISNKCQGEPCDKEKIEELFIEITNFNEEIQEAKDKIYKLIYESVEPLCTKENEDIRTNEENARCLFSVFNVSCRDWIRENILTLTPDWLSELIDTCPTITVQEAISRKLNLSRGEFDKCYIPYEDIEKIFQGEKAGKYLLSCPIVSKEDYPRYTKTLKEIEIKEGEIIKMPICTSPHNWFCCTDTPQ
ncbi:MAG: hypothetical protein Q8N73_02845 [bacterium]|nr:hypothetical protein [bacterium]